MKRIAYFIILVIAMLIEHAMQKLGFICCMTANKNLSEKFANLNKSFIAGSRGAGANYSELAEKVGNILQEQYVKQGKNFSVATVAEIVKKNNLYEIKAGVKHPEQALKTVARRVLITLGIIKTKN